METVVININFDQLRIGILGTRGIPNKYGGFEEFAEHVSKYWADIGHEVFVYCEDNLSREVFEYNNVKQIFIKKSSISTISQFIYDYRCTKHALQLDLDIIYHAGYATSVIGNILYRSKLEGKLIYNMDGLEWKRSKFSKPTKWLTKKLEKAASMSGADLVSDNKGIQDYLRREYEVESTLIEYGADNISRDVRRFEGYPKIFDLVIARFEPENHIVEIISAYERNKDATLVLVANKDTRLYRVLSQRIEKANNIIFKGPIYDKEILTFLRTNCRYYIHGHSVGGTNPSLLEALAAGCHILIHDNKFNRDVVGQHARSWSNQSALELLMTSDCDRMTTIECQKKYCSDRFNWEIIAKKHLDLFEKKIKS